MGDLTSSPSMFNFEGQNAYLLNNVRYPQGIEPEEMVKNINEKFGDILDAIYEGKLHSNTLKDSQGEAICKTGGHGLNYYYATLHGFDEMIANFAAISKANDAKEKLRMLKSIVGDEVYESASRIADEVISIEKSSSALKLKK